MEVHPNLISGRTVSDWRAKVNSRNTRIHRSARRRAGHDPFRKTGYHSCGIML
jgi:hypothetical protein